MSIWKFFVNKKTKNSLFTDILDSKKLTLGEGSTDLQQGQIIVKKLKNTENILFKREDLNPTGSFKDRSLAYQLSYHFQNGEREFVISSSGNAGISAIAYSNLINVRLHIFLSKNLPDYKLKRLLQVLRINFTVQKDGIVDLGKVVLNFTDRPKSDSLKFAKLHNYMHLRSSTDEQAFVGYKTIAAELILYQDKFDSIFIACSSGTSLVGIYEGMKDLDWNDYPAFFAIQTTKVHPIAKKYDNQFERTKTSLSSAISDRVALRKASVLEILEETNGGGYVISDNQITEAQKLLKEEEIQVSPDGALAFAGYLKYIQKESNYKKPLIIISGK